MSAQDTASTESPQWADFHFGLIVTGHTEEEHLPKLFESLKETGICNFKVIKKIEQRSPRLRQAGPRLNIHGGRHRQADPNAQIGKK